MIDFDDMHKPQSIQTCKSEGAVSLWRQLKCNKTYSGHCMHIAMVAGKGSQCLQRYFASVTLSLGTFRVEGTSRSVGATRQAACSLISSSVCCWLGLALITAPLSFASQVCVPVCSCSRLPSFLIIWVGFAGFFCSEKPHTIKDADALLPHTLRLSFILKPKKMVACSALTWSSLSTLE